MKICWRLVIFCVCPYLAHGCTTFAIGRKATADGSVIVSHSDDSGTAQDARLTHVPASDHVPNSLRAIYIAEEAFPRYVGSDFGPDYWPNSATGFNISLPIGLIPQVNHTFAYHDTAYGVINEHNVAIGESTCSAMFKTCARETSIGCEKGRSIGEALMSIDTLSKLAMERCKTAREAVKLMGQLAETYGFYGTQDPNGDGEALQVGDSDEAWTFHILADPTGRSAIWAARRVPDDEATVLSNMFTIREVDVNDTANCLASSNVYSVAQKRGWWKPGETLDFTRVYSNGEYANKYYSGRRMWGAFRLMKPSMKLSANYENLRYDRMWPWSVKPDKLVTVQDVMSWHRDYYQGTEYDMTKQPAAGPFGTPDRFATSTEEVQGAWERTIAIYRTDLVHIQQLRKPTDDLPRELAGVLWFGAGAAHYTAFVPVPSGISHALSPLVTAVPHKFSRASMSWASRKIADTCQIRFDRMHKVVEGRQKQVEDAGLALLRKAAAHFKKKASIDELDYMFADHAQKTLSDWIDLSDELIFEFSDNTFIPKDTEQKSAALGYPAWWLRSVGFQNGPPPVPVMDQCPPVCSVPVKVLV